MHGSNLSRRQDSIQKRGFRFVFAELAFDLNGRSEVDEQSVVNSRGGQVIDELYFVFSRQSQRCFQLDSNPLIDPQIGIILSDDLTIIDDSDWFLLFDPESQFLKLDSKRVLINLLEKSRAQCIMNFIGTTDDLLSEIAILHVALRESRKV